MRILKSNLNFSIWKKIAANDTKLYIHFFHSLTLLQKKYYKFVYTLGVDSLSIVAHVLEFRVGNFFPVNITSISKMSFVVSRGWLEREILTSFVYNNPAKENNILYFF